MSVRVRARDLGPACGAEALAVLCARLGSPPPPADTPASSLRDLSAAARAAGLHALAVRVDPEDLSRLPLPAVVHLRRGHWVTLLDDHGTRAGLHDPPAGPRTAGWAALAGQASGYALVIVDRP